MTSQGVVLVEVAEELVEPVAAGESGLGAAHIAEAVQLRRPAASS